MSSWLPAPACAPSVLASLASLAVALAGAPVAQARSENGFSLDGASVPAEEIRRGGPPRDGIPALDRPLNRSARQAEWSDAARVVGVVLGAQARAYPIAILNWHELVNDRLGGRPILVSWCPLCGTAMVFDRRIGGRTHRFGVSGLLYQSDLLMFDRETESLWSQISAEAVTGPHQGRRLELLRARTTTWGEWRKRHPGSTVLARDTGHQRAYASSPYGDYERSERTLFPVPLDRRYHPKMRVVGLRLADGRARVYPLVEIERSEGPVRDRFGGHAVRVAHGPEGFVVEAPGEIDVVEGYWFAWMAFHPESSVYRAGP